MYPPQKKSPYPWEMQIDDGGMGLPAPIGNAVSPPYVNPSQNIDPGGLGLPAPIGNAVSPPLMGNRQYTQQEQDFLRNNPGDEGRMAQALGNTPNYTNPSNPPSGDSTNTPGPPATSNSNSSLPRTDGWIDTSLDELKTYTGRSDWNDAMSENIRRVSQNPNWGRTRDPRLKESDENDWFNREVKRFAQPGDANTAPSTINDWSYAQGQGWTRNIGQGGMMNGRRVIPLPPPGDSTQTPGPPPLTLPPPGGTIPGQQIPPIGDSTGTPGPPAYTNPSMNPGIQAPVIRPRLPKSPSMSAGNMSSPPPPGENKFASSRKRIPNYVGK